MKLIFVLSVVLVVFLAGCSSQDTPPSSGVTDRSMVDYSFVDISSSCEIIHDINVLNHTSPYNGSKEEMFMYYTEENNWSIMYCEYDSKCTADSVSTTEYDNICIDSGDDKYTGYVFNDDGYWMAQCCNSNGGSCYVDLYVDVNDDSTVCDEEYHQNTYSIEYNETNWNALCCVGGLEE